jgi:hypothetical protein
MNCSDVKSKLPYYLSEQCSSEEKLEISKHISTCPDCMKALEELDEPILNIIDHHKSLDTRKLLSKARKALILKVATTTMLSMVILTSTFFVVIPGILKAVNSPKLPNITRSLADITQFTSPSLVGGYGNSWPSIGDYSFNITACTYEMTGTKQKGSSEVKSNFNMLTGTYQSPVQPFVQFIHPDVMVSDELLEKRTSATVKKNLIKNGDSTVAVVDISLKSVLSLEEVVASLKDLDVKVIWMAVECGSEGLKPKNMSSGQNQYVQWGIPGKLFNPTNMTPAKLDYSSPTKYKKAVIEELKWLEENKKYIAADKFLLKYQAFDNSVGSNAKYIVDNGLKVYGLRITGPSTELIKLGDKLEIRMEQVMDIDFYYWK